MRGARACEKSGPCSLGCHDEQPDVSSRTLSYSEIGNIGFRAALVGRCVEDEEIPFILQLQRTCLQEAISSEAHFRTHKTTYTEIVHDVLLAGCMTCAMQILYFFMLYFIRNFSAPSSWTVSGARV